MRYLKIQNKGLLDIRLVALMGGTTKTDNQYKIGQFGTGLKYTLAYLLRNNIAFKIFVGNKEVIIKTELDNTSDLGNKLLLTPEELFVLLKVKLNVIIIDSSRLFGICSISFCFIIPFPGVKTHPNIFSLYNFARRAFSARVILL